MGTVTGSVHSTGSLSLPLSNIIGGTDPFTISPTLGLTEANPTLSIIPLSDKDFTVGMLQPISPEILGYFLNQGWDAEFILPLVVEGVQCPNMEKRILNRGEFTEGKYSKFARMFAEAGRASFSIRQMKRQGDTTATFRLPAKEALAFVKDGLGADRKIVSMTADGDNAKLEVADVETYWVARGLNPAWVCEPGNAEAEVAVHVQQRSALYSDALSGMFLKTVPDHSPLKKRETASGALLLRSVESIIYFLGEAQRIQGGNQIHACGGRPVAGGKHPRFLTYRKIEDGKATENILFRAIAACHGDAVPLRPAVRTSLNGRDYYIPPLAGRYDEDRSLKTLSFLSELIALQTSQALIQSATPTIAVTR